MQKKKPEVGSCLIFQLNNKNHIPNLNLVGVSSEFYEATTKILLRSKLEKIEKPKSLIVTKNKQKKKKRNPPKIESSQIIRKLQLRRNLKLKLKKNIKDEDNNEESMGYNNLIKSEDKDNNIDDSSIVKLENNKNRKKRKRKNKRYIRNSTIITINKIK